MSETIRKIKDGVVDAAEAVGHVAVKGAEKVGEGAQVVGGVAASAGEAVYDGGKAATHATGDALKYVGKKMSGDGK